QRRITCECANRARMKTAAMPARNERESIRCRVAWTNGVRKKARQDRLCSNAVERDPACHHCIQSAAEVAQADVACCIPGSRERPELTTRLRAQWCSATGRNESDQ